MSQEDPTETTETEKDAYLVRFGAHVRSLRESRSLTQQTLAELSTLAVDTIARLERGDFAPSLTTLRKLAMGLSVELSVIFESFGNTVASPRRFGLYIRGRRTKREMSEADLAAASTLPVEIIREIERGESSPNLDRLRKLAAGFDLRLSTLFDDFERGPFGE